MTLYLDIMVALLIALVLALMLTLHFSRSGGNVWAGFAFFFTILLLSIWAAGLWVRRPETLFAGAPWVAFLVTGIIVALLLGMGLAPSRRPTTLEDANEERAAATVTFGITFWLIVLLLIGVILARSYQLAADRNLDERMETGPLSMRSGLGELTEMSQAAR